MFFQSCWRVRWHLVAVLIVRLSLQNSQNSFDKSGESFNFCFHGCDLFVPLGGRKSVLFCNSLLLDFQLNSLSTGPRSRLGRAPSTNVFEVKPLRAIAVPEISVSLVDAPGGVPHIDVDLRDPLDVCLSTHGRGWYQNRWLGCRGPRSHNGRRGLAMVAQAYGVTLIRATSQHHCLRLSSISKIAENTIFDPEKQMPQVPIIPMRVSQGSVLEKRKEGKIGAEARSAGMFVYVASTTS
jgi:hypothetical protein